jgi:hypothetical protein
MISVLQNFKSGDLKLDPFPHIYIENVYPPDLYEKLANEYPEHILKGVTTGFSDFRYCQHEFGDDISDTWKEFIEYHTSKKYKDELISLLAPGMKKYYPDIYDKYLNSEVCLRNETVKGALRLEVQFVMNAIDAKSIRSPHVDAARELFASLFYMKKLNDNSSGGDLVLYKKKKKDFIFGSTRQAPVEDIEAVKTIPYKANSMIIFLNTEDSIHGVSERYDATTIRRYVNIDGHVKEKLFKF